MKIEYKTPQKLGLKAFNALLPPLPRFTISAEAALAQSASFGTSWKSSSHVGSGESRT